MRALLSIALLSAVACSAHAQFVIRMLHVAAPESPAMIATKIFGAEVANRSGGKISVVLVPSKSATEIVGAVRASDAEVGITSTVALGRFEPSFGVFELPFLFQDLGSVSRFQAGQGGEVLRSRLQKQGLNTLGFFHEGMAVIAARRPVHVPDDLKGLKFAALQPQNLANAQLSALGANIIQVPSGDLSRLIERGTADGFVGSFSVVARTDLLSSKISLTMSRHAYVGFVLFSNQAALDKLPMNLRDSLRTAAQATETQTNQEILKRIAGLAQNVYRYPTRIVSLNSAELDKWQSAMKPAWSEFDRRIGVDITKYAIAAGTGGGGQPCAKLEECRCDDRTCKVSCCTKDS